MVTFVIPLAIAGIYVCYLFYQTAMRPRLPGPHILKYTNLHARIIEVAVTLSKGAGFLNKLHKTYGPVVQFSRNEASINDVTGIRDVYAVTRRLDRPDPLVIFHNYQAENLVSTEAGNVHQERRKPIRSIYSASAIEAQDTQRAIQASVARLIKHIEAIKDPVEVKPVLRPLLYEIMSHVVYGKEHALDLFSDATQRAAIEADTQYQEERLFNPLVLIVAFLPRFTLWLRRNNLAPRSIAGHFPVDLVSDRIGREALAALKARKIPSNEGSTQTESLIHRLYSYYATNGPSTAIPSEAYFLSDCIDHFWAGVSTTVDGLSPLVHHLSRPENASRQERLRHELHSAGLGPGSLVPSTPTLKQLPYLDAVIRETLRLNPPIPASMTRKVSEREGPISVCGHEIRPGMTIGASPHVIGRNPDVYDEPEKWVPERWLLDGGADSEGGGGARRNEKLRAMKSHFFAFGAGPRMCLGVNVAWASMRAAVAGLYSNFATELVEAESAGWFSGMKASKVRFRKLDGTNGRSTQGG